MMGGNLAICNEFRPCNLVLIYILVMVSRLTEFKDLSLLLSVIN